MTGCTFESKDGPPVPVKSPLPVSVSISGRSGGSMLSGGIVGSTGSIGGCSSPAASSEPDGGVIFGGVVLFPEPKSDGGVAGSSVGAPLNKLNNPGRPCFAASITVLINCAIGSEK